MAKKQTRRSISVRGLTYSQLRDHCTIASISMSDFIEQRIADFFAANPIGARPASPTPDSRVPAPRLVPPLVDRRPAARVAAVLPAPAARPVPSSSAINRPVPVAARRAVSPPTFSASSASASSGSSALSGSLISSGSSISSLSSRQSAPHGASISQPISQLVSAPIAVSHHGAVGRPAPTPAAEVLKERLTPAAPRDAKDYRALRF